MTRYLVLAIATVLAMAALANGIGTEIHDDPIILHGNLVADNDDRKGRRDDRQDGRDGKQDGRDDNRDDRRNCRQEEGRVGNDKRECKREDDDDKEKDK